MSANLSRSWAENAQKNAEHYLPNWWYHPNVECLVQVSYGAFITDVTQCFLWPFLWPLTPPLPVRIRNVLFFLSHTPNAFLAFECQFVLVSILCPYSNVIYGLALYGDWIEVLRIQRPEGLICQCELEKKWYQGNSAYVLILTSFMAWSFCSMVAD